MAGRDPTAERDKNQAETPTFEATARQVWADQMRRLLGTKKRGRSGFNTRRDHAFPVIGLRPAHNRAADVLRVLAPIWAEVGAGAGHPGRSERPVRRSALSGHPAE